MFYKNVVWSYVNISSVLQVINSGQIVKLDKLDFDVTCFFVVWRSIKLMMSLNSQ